MYRSALTKILIASVTCLVGGANAATLLNDFNSSGTWTTNGITVTQSGTGFGEVSGVDSSLNYAEYYFSNSLNIGADNVISVRGLLLGGNTATNFSVSLFNDDTLQGVSAVFSTAAFNSGGYTTVDVVLSPNIAFNPAAVDFIRISGVAPSGGGTIALRIDSISVSAIPEPATFAGLMGLAALGYAAARRRRLAA